MRKNISCLFSITCQNTKQYLLALNLTHCTSSDLNNSGVINKIGPLLNPIFACTTRLIRRETSDCQKNEKYVEEKHKIA